MTQTLINLDFPHNPPEGYSYQFKQHNASTISIWLLHHRRYVFHNSDASISTIWGFCKRKHGKKGSSSTTYFSPINSNKIGKEVSIDDTSPYTAMQLNLNPLELALYG
tara:strand:+ start:56583 stop:56906 length:324 start_codon:yes stop_codon:yes gene_type:complete